MAINFPDSPTDGQEFIIGGRVFIYDASRSSWFKSIQNTSLNGLSDVDTASPTADQSLIFNGSVWTNMDGGGGLTTYATVSGLPTSGNSNGALAFVTANNRLYIWNGGGWYSIALINQSPTAITGNDASYGLASDGTPLVITLVSEDPEGFDLTWSYSISSGTLGSTATIEQTDNVFTITPSTDSSNAGEFGVTFSVTEGTNITTSISSFVLGFTPEVSSTNGITTNVTVDGSDYQVIYFLQNDTATFNIDGDWDMLIVAGGGGGGSHIGGGGGAGGMITQTGYTINAGTYAITIGAGGSGSPDTSSTGTNGGDTTFGSLFTAIGGGYGGSGYGSGQSGGSGGGVAHGYGGGGGTPGSGTAGQGNSGGNGNQTGGHTSGGGGGKAGSGANGTTNGPSGVGGAGELWNLDGLGYYYAGGGGGGGYTGAGGNGGIGGGGGGTSQHSSDGSGGGSARNNGGAGGGDPAGSGGANTGGGGGGGGHANMDGGAGGSGIIILRQAL